MNRKLVVAIFVFLALASVVGNATAQDPGPTAPQAPLGSGFTYQGQLKNANGPVNDTCDFQFSLWDAVGSGTPPTGGTQLGTTQSLTAGVTNGLFTVVLNDAGQFGSNAFTGEARWLQIAVRCPAGSSTYTTLSPRQALTAMAYALSLRPNATINGLNNMGDLSFGSTLRQMLNLWKFDSGPGSYGIGVQNATMYFRANTGADGFAWYAGGSHSDIARDPGFLGRIYALLDSRGLIVTNQITATNQIAGSTNRPYLSGVIGTNTGQGNGVTGISNGCAFPEGCTAGAGIYGQNTAGGFAGYFVGDVYVGGTLSKSAGSFKIDHPLDPANKYLQHSFVESPDMMNIYNGNVTTDAHGAATVQLPDYFEALNRDFRYQLTVVGQFAQAIVAAEVHDNQFAIKTDKPFVKVSWQVTGIRQDPYANDHRIQVEVNKSPDERGKYLYPNGYRQPESKSIYARHDLSSNNLEK